MKNRIDTKGLLMHYLLKRDGEVNEDVVSYCLNEIESGRGKRALKGRLEIKVDHINFNNWNDCFYDLQKALYND